MTQPPDEPRPPDTGEPADAARATPPPDAPAPENAPTVSWSRPSEPSPPSDPGRPQPAVPYGSSPSEPPPPSPGWEIPAAASPIVSASPTGGWEVPGGPRQPVMLREGYIVGSTGARFVAWLIDGALATVVPGILFFFVFDWRSFFQQMFDQMQFDAQGRLIPNYAASF